MRNASSPKTEVNFSEPIVLIENLSKEYQLGEISVKALRNIDLQINPGEYIAIMGPSGSGKSTLLNLLGCLDKPSSGKYQLGPDNISELDDDQLSRIRCSQIGFIFQSYNLLPQLNIIENIEVPLYYQGTNERKSKAKAKQLAEMVGLADRIKHKPNELSGGQQQRVAIARALVNDPIIILGDEPTGNLDSKSGGEILKILDELNKQGKTMIIVTHDEQVASRANRRVHLIDGKIDRIESN